MKHRIKMSSTDYDKMAYVAHMIGQVQECDITVETKHIASWLNVSKPTAIKYLEYMVDCGMVVKSEKKWRKNAVKFTWHLTDKAWSKFVGNGYLAWYRHYKQLVLQVSQSRGSGVFSL